jgi:hydrogenase/urease accessory protein HupE
LPQGHQQLFFAIDLRGKRADADYGPTLREETLSVENDSVTVEIPRMPSTAPTTGAVADAKTQPTAAPPAHAAPVKRISFFALCVQHIVTGYDHLLFLAALLLVCRNFREAASVITFFTIAHTITLTLAALGYVRLPGRIVEPAIAASIVYVGLENIFGRHRFIWRALVTFGFGLVHGLGFAAALSEVGLGRQGVGLAMPLLKFSVGLETGQLCIAAVILNVMLALRRREWFERRWVPAGSVVVSIIGAYWLVTRVIAG